MSESTEQWRIFWKFVRSERVITVRFFLLVAVVLLAIAVVVGSVVALSVTR